MQDEDLKRLQKRVQGHIRARVSNQADADDIIQDAMIELMHDLPSFDPEKGTLGAFMKIRCRRAISNHFRKNKPLDDQKQVDDAIPPNDTAAEHDHLLQITLNGEDKLHQLLAFAYIHLLEWKPAEIVQDLLGETLEALGRRFFKSYAAFQPAREEHLRELLAPFLTRAQGRSDKLPDYLQAETPKKQAVELTRWRHTVHRRIVKDLERLGITSRTR